MIFTLKPILTTAILIGSVLIEQSAIAYPKTSSHLELDYIKASMENIYDEVTPEMLDYLEQLYNNQDPNTELMLSGGYHVCDGIKLANAQGIDSQTLVEQEISQISAITNSILQQQGMSLTEAQIITAYKTANSYLCPELE